MKKVVRLECLKKQAFATKSERLPKETGVCLSEIPPFAEKAWSVGKGEYSCLPT
jgi:hypothetical protein